MRTAVIVTTNPPQHLLDAMTNVADFDVVFVESAAGAYSKVRHVSPNLVIVCLSLDDPLGFQVLSTLNVSDETSHIPVTTYVTTNDDSQSTIPVHTAACERRVAQA